MVVRSLTGVILMIIGLGFMLSGANPELWDSPSMRWAVLAAGFSFWIIGSLVVFIVCGRGAGSYWLGGIMIIIGLLSFLGASSIRAAISPTMVPMAELQRSTLFSFAVVSIVFGAFYMLMVSALPALGESWPQGSPQRIPPPMPVKEPPKAKDEASSEDSGRSR